MIYYNSYTREYIYKREYVYTVAGAPKQRGTSEVSANVRGRVEGIDCNLFLLFWNNFSVFLSSLRHSSPLLPLVVKIDRTHAQIALVQIIFAIARRKNRLEYYDIFEKSRKFTRVVKFIRHS